MAAVAEEEPVEAEGLRGEASHRLELLVHLDRIEISVHLGDARLVSETLQLAAPLPDSALRLSAIDGPVELAFLGYLPGVAESQDLIGPEICDEIDNDCDGEENEDEVCSRPGAFRPEEGLLVCGRGFGPQGALTLGVSGCGPEPRCLGVSDEDHEGCPAGARAVSSCVLIPTPEGGAALRLAAREVGDPCGEGCMEGCEAARCEGSELVVALVPNLSDLNEEMEAFCADCPLADVTPPADGTPVLIPFEASTEAVVLCLLAKNLAIRRSRRGIQCLPWPGLDP